MPTIDFLWNEWDDNLFQETDEHGVVTSYVTMPGKHGEVLYDQQGNRFTYYHNDGNGSTHKLTGANQAVTKTYIFNGFGELIASLGLGSTPFAYKGAAGYYTNPVTNDIYVRARTYEPTTGRWLSKDPLGFVDGPNLYGAYFVPSADDPLGQLVAVDIDKVNGNCGAKAGVKFLWKLSQTYAEDGFIVQQIKFYCAEKRCPTDGCFCEVDLPANPSVIYYELWNVAKNQTNATPVNPGTGKNDHQWSVFSNGFCAKRRVEAEARFYLSSQVKGEVDLWRDPGTLKPLQDPTLCNILSSLPTEIGGYGGVDNPPDFWIAIGPKEMFSFDISWNWDCCPGANWVGWKTSLIT